MKLTKTETCLLFMENISYSWSGSKLMLLTDVKASNISGQMVILLIILLLAVAVLGLQLRKSAVARRQKEVYIAQLRQEVNHLENDVHQLCERNDWLVTEMHHRVKNNLQILNSLINSQISYVGDNKGREALLNSKHRLYALSLVHQKLFQTSMISNIDICCYITELVDYLADEYQSRKKVEFVMDMLPLTLDIAIATPLAQIVNELVSNALKFAFPGESSGSVQIALTTDDRLHYRLTVADNGVGLAEGVEFGSARSLGRSLIMGLAQQIRAKVAVHSEAGLKFIIDFEAAQIQHSYLEAC